MSGDGSTGTGTARREEILARSAELFAEHSYHGVGMRAIAEAVGVRSSSLYYHFPSKMDILHALALEVTERFIDYQLPRLEGPGSRAERIHGLFREHIEYFWAHHVEEAVVLRELRELEPKRRRHVNKIRRRYQEALIEFVEEGRAEGDFDVDDTLVSTMAALNMINGVNEWFRPDGPLTIEQLASAYADIAVYRVFRAKRPARRKGARARARSPASG